MNVFNPKRTYAFVTYSTEQSAKECIGAGPHTLNGRVVHVDLGKNDTRKGPTEKSHKPPYRETRAPPTSGQRESRDQGFDLRHVLEEKRSTSGGTGEQAAHSRQGQQSAREKHSTVESAKNIVKDTLSENVVSNPTPENLEKKTLPEQESESDPPNHGRPGKTEKEKIALKLQKMKEINMKK